MQFVGGRLLILLQMLQLLELTLSGTIRFMWAPCKLDRSSSGQSKYEKDFHLSPILPVSINLICFPLRKQQYICLLPHTYVLHTTPGHSHHRPNCDWLKLCLSVCRCQNQCVPQLQFYPLSCRFHQPSQRQKVHPRTRPQTMYRGFPKTQPHNARLSLFHFALFNSVVGGVRCRQVQRVHSNSI